MPNYCSNYAVITGRVEGMKEINKKINRLRELERSEIPLVAQQSRSILFETLIGNNKELLEELKGDWYWHNVHHFGTKWDVGTEFVVEQEEDQIILSGDTAWSPPINFYLVLAEKYKLDIEYQASEPGNDFYIAGSIYNKYEENLIHEQNEWEYDEGVYHNDGYCQWLESEFMSGIDFIDRWEIKDEKQAREILEENFAFLDEQEMNECMDEIIEALEEIE